MSADLRPSHTAAITITITMHRERIVLVELLQAEYTHAHSTNRLRRYRSRYHCSGTGPLRLVAGSKADWSRVKFVLVIVPDMIQI